MKKSLLLMLAVTLLIVPTLGAASASDRGVLTIQNEAPPPEASTFALGDFSLVATPVSGSDTKISLSWGNPKVGDLPTYRIYSKSSAEAVFQTTPAKEDISVLHVYPTAASNVLKGWMDAQGLGKIKVTPVIASIFNNNPSQLNGYDVVVFGFANGNENVDLNANSLATVRNFIEAGYGALFGHDTITRQDGYPRPYMSQLANYANLDLRTTGTNQGGTKVKILKRGLLTNYPWDIGDIGTILTIPHCHVLGQIAKGERWLEFSDVVHDEWNTYLSSWNNTALAQTGHSGSQATVDEQRLLANTIFYLAQTTDIPFKEDRMCQDVNKPNAPSLSLKSTNVPTNRISLNASATDVGSTYNYYVTAQFAGDSYIYTSNTVTTTVTSGVKGYSAIVDTSPSTVVTSSIITGIDNLACNYINKTFYVHVAAVDHMGNISATSHFKFDDAIAPSLTLSAPAVNAFGWHNKDVNVTVISSDAETGIDYVINPNGTKTYSTSYTYTLTSSGTYLFTAFDKAGNKINKSITVNIDKNKPAVNVA